jgi:hypothetical protein
VIIKSWDKATKVNALSVLFGDGSCVEKFVKSVTTQNEIAIRALTSPQAHFPGKKDLYIAKPVLN